MISKLELFAGAPIRIIDGVNLYSPKIKEIVEIGELKYLAFLSLCTFDTEKILVGLFRLNEEEVNQFLEKNNFDVLTSHSSLTQYLCEALSFFTKGKITFSENQFYCDGIAFCNRNNYQEISNAIKLINGIISTETKKLKFKNEKAKQMFERMNVLRKKYKKNDQEDLELKDILSILCNATGNGINIFNVFELTVYQVYEHYERLNILEEHKKIFALWSNTFSLKEDGKLIDWRVKSKL